MATGKEIRDRAFALSGAILFFISACALTFAIIYDNVRNKDTSADAKPASSQTANGKKLEGTKLANFTPLESVTELKSEDLKPGDGKEITSVANTITADYTGALANTGVIFQSSLDTGQPFTTKLSGVIKGWQEGMIGMKEGGQRRLMIPAAEAYGDQSSNGIPANSDLVFDITLHKVE